MIFCGPEPEQIIFVPKLKLAGGVLKLQAATEDSAAQSKKV